MLEADFESAVVDLAHLFGWVAAGFRPARTKHGWRTPVKHDGAGFPDLTLVHAERRILLFAELKTDTGRLSPEQEQWGNVLTLAMRQTPDVRYHVWRPADADDVARTLSNGKITEWRLV